MKSPIFLSIEAAGAGGYGTAGARASSVASLLLRNGAAQLAVVVVVVVVEEGGGRGSHADGSFRW